MTTASQRLLQHIRGAIRRSATDKASDAVLLGRYVHQRDESAFATLVAGHGPMVLSVCRRALRDAGAAEDAFQATFLVLARKAARISRPAHLAGWLHGTARHVALRSNRSERRRRGCEARFQLHAPSRQIDLVDELSGRELLGIVDEELGRLPEKFRSPLVLCSLEGRSQEEAARVLGLTPAAVKGRLERGRHQLRAALARRGIVVPAAFMVVEVCATAAKACVPASLLATTIRGALSFCPNDAATACSASLQATALARETLHALIMAKVRALVVLLLALGLASSAAGLVLSPGAEPPPEGAGAQKPVLQDDTDARRSSDVTPDASAVKRDLFGDPLPPGALARMGTLRFQHGAQIPALAFSRDGKMLATGGMDLSIDVWDAVSGIRLKRLKGHEQHFGNMVFAPDGKTLVSGDVENNVIVWDLTTGTAKHRLKGANPLFSRRGDKLFVARSKVGSDMRPSLGYLFGINAEAMACWEIKQGNCIAAACAAKGHPLAISSDGKLLASLTGKVTDGSPVAPKDGMISKCSIHIFDLEHVKELHQLSLPKLSLPNSTAWRSAAFSARGLTIVGDSQDVLLWEYASSGRLRKVKVPSGVPCLSPDATSVATVDHRGTIRIRDIVTGKETRSFSGPIYLLSVCFSPDGKRLATGGFVPQIWEIETGKDVIHEAHRGLVDSVGVAPNGKVIFSSAEDGTIRIWERETGRQVRLFQNRQEGNVTSVAFSGDGKLIACPGWESIALLDASTGKQLRRFEKLKAHVAASAFSADSRLLAAVGADGVLRTWELNTGKQLWQTPSGLHANFYRLTFSPDGHTVGLAGSNLGEVALWDAASGEKVRELSTGLPVPRPDRTCTLAFAADGRSLVVGFVNRLQLWETATAKRRVEISLHSEKTGWSESISALALSPDGRLLAVGSNDGTIQLANGFTGAHGQRFLGHKGVISSMVFAPDGSSLISSSHDTTLLVWDLKRAHRQAEQRVNLSAEGLQKCWQDLASMDAAEAYQSMLKLAAAPKSASFFQTRLQPVPAPDPRQLTNSIRDLKNGHFEKRQSATRRLESLVDVAEPLLREAIKEADLETRSRLQSILARLRSPSGQVLQGVRTVEVLERIGSPQARKLLANLARGAPQALVTREAVASLRRLK